MTAPSFGFVIPRASEVESRKLPSFDLEMLGLASAFEDAPAAVRHAAGKYDRAKRLGDVIEQAECLNVLGRELSVSRAARRRRSHGSTARRRSWTRSSPRPTPNPSNGRFSHRRARTVAARTLALPWGGAMPRWAYARAVERRQRASGLLDVGDRLEGWRLCLALGSRWSARAVTQRVWRG